MPKFKFTNFYRAPNPPTEPFIVEAADEDVAWELWSEKITIPIENAFICEEVVE